MQYHWITGVCRQTTDPGTLPYIYDLIYYT